MPGTRVTNASATLLLLLLLAPHAVAEDAPTADEWAPVQQAIATHAPDAGRRLRLLLRQHPRWADGYRELAKLALQAQAYPEALEHAVRALALDGDQVEAACVQVQALAALGRYSAIWPAIDAFTGTDKGGWLHFYGARAAWQANDVERADQLLHQARLRVPNSAPVDFYLLAARIDLQKKDFDGARTDLEQATDAQPDSAIAWYELGRIELAEADDASTPSDRAVELIDKANGHFEQAQHAGMASDPMLLYGLGYARYEQAKHLLGQDEDRGMARLRDAVPVLQQATAAQPTFGLAHYVLGNVLVQLGDWHAARQQLEAARDLQVMDRPGYYNLALALEHDGEPAQANAILAAHRPETPNEQIQVAMHAYNEHDDALAASLFEPVVPQLSADPERQAAVLRFLGHARRNVAAHATGAEQQAALDGAAEAYGAAGDLHDHIAQEDYLALETERGAATGFPAAWRYVRWHNGMTLKGWTSWLGNYGRWLTGGAGIAGAWLRHPGQVVGWGIATGLPLLLGLSLLLRRAVAPAPVPVPTPAPGTREPLREAAPRDTPSREVAERETSPSRLRVHSTPPPRRTTTPVLPPARGKVTTPRPKQPNQRTPIDQQKTETEEMPQVKDTDQLHPSHDVKETGALERKQRP